MSGSGNTRRSKRLLDKSNRLDYRVFNDTGERAYRYDLNFNNYRDTSISESDTDSNSTVQRKSESDTGSDSSDIGCKIKFVAEIAKATEICPIMTDSGSSEVNASKMNAEVKNLQMKLWNIEADIIDHFEENQIDDSYNVVEDIDMCISKIERLRTEFRKMFFEVRNVLPEDDDNQVTEKTKISYRCEGILIQVKDYIIKAKEARLLIRRDEAKVRRDEEYVKMKAEKDTTYHKMRSSEFLLNEVTRMITELYEECSKLRDNTVSDGELMRRKDVLQENLVKWENLSKMLQKFIETMPEEFPESADVLKKVDDDYNRLIREKGEYEKFVKTQLQEREILKESLFKKSSLNIKLKSFKGYSSDLDIFSFQAEFEKMYPAFSTPKKMLPDLLKNNHLEGPALALVKRQDDIDEIWKRLHKAYGDPRIMLKNKLADVKSIGPLWRIKDPERLKESLNALINCIHDLLTISEKFHIEQKLYHGGALETILSLLGDTRMTKWLYSICNEEDLEEHQKWEKLRSFLEKELKIQEEKTLLHMEKNNDEVEKYPRTKTKSKSYVSSNVNSFDPMKCTLCDQLGHYMTNGPKGIKLVQSVWNLNSLSSSCRIVFNASLPTPSGRSLNNILAKGRNNLNKLVEVVIRWRSLIFADHTDVEQMYPTIKLDPEQWCLQRYLFQENLDPCKVPEEKVIKTLIFGVKSSGNQAEHGLRLTARLSKDEYPEVCQIVHHDVYVDDCLSGEESKDLMYQRADEIILVLKRGGFNLKGFTFSCMPPSDKLTEDGESVKVAGMRWFSESDELQLDVGNINFAKKVRGKKVVSEENCKIPEKLTRRMCVGKVAEMYDLTGRFTPIIANMKLDLRELVMRQLEWDDVIPDDLRHVWVSHIEMIREISHVRFRRAVVPVDAVSKNLHTIDCADSSMSIACCAIYVRFARKGGDFSCQLLFARSKLHADGITQPRAELAAATLNTHTGEVVRRSLKRFHEFSVKTTDSKITLHWINNKEIPLKQWVRNRVVEICRFTDPKSWMHVGSADMVADLGTRRGVKIDDVLPGSKWDVGLPWMTRDISEFPATSYNEMKLSEEEKVAINSEVIKCNSFTTHVTESNKADEGPVPKEVEERYRFSKYIVDPNRYRFRTVVRIIAILLRFVNNCRTRVQKRKNHIRIDTEVIRSNDEPIELVFTDKELESAANYYYRKATAEVVQFVKAEKYERISTERNNILYYTGRVLPGQQCSVISNITDVMKDLTMLTFCVPIIEKHSPVAYSIVNEVHWYCDVAKHTGVETNMRFVLNYAYILGGRELVKKVRKGCERCRYLYKRTVDVAMGPISQHNITIAPPFYVCQVDLVGPFNAYSPHQRRTTVKIWFVVFCCTTTTTINIKVLEDYSTSSFLSAFTRFSCEVGYPKLLIVDEGSQLKCGCENMGFMFRDLQNQLSKEKNVEFQCVPVGGHNMNGRVERKIRHIRESVDKSMQGLRISILQWETLGSSVANAINDLPIGIKNVVADLEHIDLITPNRLRLGRNNQRSPVGTLLVTGNPEKIMSANQEIFNSWFQLWLVSCVPKLIEQPKWFQNSRGIQVGDIVLFLKKAGEVKSFYQYGKVNAAVRSRDGKVRKVTVTYRNANEDVYRETNRAVRELIVIHAVDELNVVAELGKVATVADVMFMLRKL